jgi:hypothetical protein
LKQKRPIPQKCKEPGGKPYSTTSKTIRKQIRDRKSQEDHWLYQEVITVELPGIEE